MAVRPNMGRSSQRGLKKMVVTVLFITCMGWLILFTWSMWLLARDGFESACIAVHRVSIFQMQTLSVFHHASWFKGFQASFTPVWTKNTSDLRHHMQDTQHAIQDTAIKQWQLHVPARSIEGEEGLGKALQDMQLHLAQCWYLFCAAGRVLGVKLTVLLTSVPLFLWATVAGLVDGLNQRAIRTACLGRESTYVFHKSIPLMKGCLLVGLSLWLSLPLVLPPSLVFVSLAILVSVSVSVSASRFKKYV